MMELGFILDDRTLGTNDDYIIKLTPNGTQLFNVLRPLIDTLDLGFKEKDGDIPTWEMKLATQEFNQLIWQYLREHHEAQEYVQQLFIGMHAVGMMLNYLYRVERRREVEKSSVYEGFFSSPFVRMYCDQNGIEAATTTGAEHRCPFLLNILESLGVLRQSRSSVDVDKFVICRATMTLKSRESEGDISQRVLRVSSIMSKQAVVLNAEELSLLKEAFGREFATDEYYMKDFVTVV